VDYDWATSVLNEYQQLVRDVQNTTWLSKERRAAVKQLNNRCPAVNGILQNLSPGLGQIVHGTLSDHVAGLGRIGNALRLLAAARAMAAAARQLAEPALPLSLLHPLVRIPAQLLWAAGNHRHAVSDAATNVSNYTQKRLGRYDISDKDLMAQAFTDKEPEQGKHRLRCPGNQNSQAVRSQQIGALMFSQGCFQAIRNPAHHMTGDWNPVTAFEHLAALSTVARWVCEWDVAYYYPPVDLTLLTAKTVQVVIDSKTQAQPTPTAKTPAGKPANGAKQGD
jgi:hypothetical protein